MCPLCHCPLLYFSLICNGPPPMSTLVPAWRQRCLKLCWESEWDLPCQCSNEQLAQWNTISSLELSPSCHHVARWRRKTWCLDTHGFIPKKIQWHIHAGRWSLVMAQSAYEALYKVLMNINDSGCRPYGMASALIVISVSVWYPNNNNLTQAIVDHISYEYDCRLMKGSNYYSRTGFLTSVLNALDNVPLTYGKRDLKWSIVLHLVNNYDYHHQKTQTFVEFDQEVMSKYSAGLNWGERIGQ